MPALADGQGGGAGDNTTLRRQQVNALLGKITMWLMHLDTRLGSALLEFERRKDGGAHIQAKPMPGVYATERTAYVKSKKTFAPSATRLDGFAQDFGREGKVSETADMALAKVELWDYMQEPGFVHIWEFAARNFRLDGHVNGTHVNRAAVQSIPLRG